MASKLESDTRLGRFFENQRTNSTYLGPAILVVLLALVGVLGASSALSIAPMAGSLTPMLVIMTVFGSVLGGIVKWVIWTGLLYAGTLVFDSEGKFSTLLVLLSWAYLPMVVHAGILNQLRMSAVGPGATPMGGSSQGLALLLTVVFVLVTGYASVYAVKHARRVTTRQAAIVVGLFVLARLAFEGGGLLLTRSVMS
jgi:hypothetical protein